MLSLKSALPRLVGVALLVTLVLALVPTDFALAQISTVTISAVYQDEVLVQRDTASTTDLGTLDPQVAFAPDSITAIENLFHGLTNYDPLTTQVTAELATAWTISDDGLTWTFTLRDDVLWYRYDPTTRTATELRPVVAGDVVYGIQRGCDPRLRAAYGYVAASIIAGCDVVNGTPAKDATDELVFGDTVKVSAPNDTTVVIEVRFPAGYFFSMTPMWIFRPVHRETVAEFGDEWTAPGNIATNGAYFIEENTRGVRRVFVRNEHHNADLGFGGNIDVINVTVYEDAGTIFTLYQTHQLDSAGIPPAELEWVLEDAAYASELNFTTDLAVFYFGFGYDKPPFDNVHVRRAFSAIIDREAFVAQTRQNRGLPMIHFTPPGMAHAVPINEVGVGFDPEYAQAELEAAGYPNCAGFPNVNMAVFADEASAVEFLASSAEEYLGCPHDLFTVEQLNILNMIEVISANTPTEDRPHIWTFGWLPDYADANNYLHDVLSCESANDFKRPCTAIDDLINAAARETDPIRRDQMYREIEEAFFGAEGEFPIAPVFMRVDYMLNKPWYTGPFTTDGLFGGAHWDAYHIDMAAKLAAREE